MIEVPVNYWAVLAGGVISMILGSLWYGPLFGKPWMAMMGLSKGNIDATAKSKMIRAYSLMFVGSLITSYILSHIITFSMTTLGGTGIMVGISTAFWVWLGFVAPMTVGTVLWEGKPWKLWILNNGYNLLFLILAGIVLALWR